MYDIYKLAEHAEIDDDFLKLVREVCAHRIDMGSEIAPATPLDVDILELVRKACDEDFYKEDYREITLKLIPDSLEYEMLKRHYRELVEKEIGHNIIVNDLLRLFIRTLFWSSVQTDILPDIG